MKTFKQFLDEARTSPQSVVFEKLVKLVSREVWQALGRNYTVATTLFNDIESAYHDPMKSGVPGVVGVVTIYVPDPETLEDFDIEMIELLIEKTMKSDMPEIVIENHVFVDHDTSKAATVYQLQLLSRDGELKLELEKRGPFDAQLKGKKQVTAW